MISKKANCCIVLLIGLSSVHSFTTIQSTISPLYKPLFAAEKEAEELDLKAELTAYLEKRKELGADEEAKKYVLYHNIMKVRSTIKHSTVSMVISVTFLYHN